ncbi:MAG: vWA domain-containing protein [Planctomycetota bacterium]
MKRMIVTMVLAALAVLGGAQTLRAEESRPRVQIAILLDTSGSMDGLINQARAQIWKIVNEFATAKKNGVRPLFEVALFEYGNDGQPASEGHIRLILPLTDDLDKVSEELFRLTTNGGQEYCGQVIRAAIDRLTWSASNDDLKVVFIAGNEPFTQGGVDFRASCRAAIGKGIMVNTIFCGGFDEGVSTQWKEGADLADGAYMNIDQNSTEVPIPAPQDVEIVRLGEALNATYIAYGRAGEEAGKRQLAQDANAAGAGAPAAAQRAEAKASEMYRNDGWDLVDAEKEGKKDVSTMPADELPAEMQAMTPAEREAFIARKRAEREALQARIRELSAARDVFVAEKRKELTAEGADTLDGAMIRTLRSQAAGKAYEFGK